MTLNINLLFIYESCIISRRKELEGRVISAFLYLGENIEI